MPDDPLLDELRALEAELHHHGRPRPRDRLERLLHPDFHEVGRSGRRDTREIVIAYLRSLAEPPIVDADDHAVHRLCVGCALLTYRSVHRDADARDVVLRSSIGLLAPVGCQLVSHQGTPAAAAET